MLALTGEARLLQSFIILRWIFLLSAAFLVGFALIARKGWWQDRNRAWLDLGIRSELGRGEGDRACPGGSPLPGNGSRKDYRPGATKAAAHG